MRVSAFRKKDKSLSYLFLQGRNFEDPSRRSGKRIERKKWGKGASGPLFWLHGGPALWSKIQCGGLLDEEKKPRTTSSRMYELDTDDFSCIQLLYECQKRNVKKQTGITLEKVSQKKYILLSVVLHHQWGNFSCKGEMMSSAAVPSCILSI